MFSSTVFIVVMEDDYGDKEQLKVFHSKKDAKDYMVSICSDKDRYILEESLSNCENEVYVVVLKERYGGGWKIKAFTNEDDAHKYSNSIGGVVLKRNVE